MQSMTVPETAHTITAADDTDGIIGDALGVVFDLADSYVPGGTLGLVAAVGILCWGATEANKRRVKDDKGNSRGAFDVAVERFFDRASKGAGRWLTGLPVSGKPTDAGWLRPASRTVVTDAEEGTPTAMLGAEAMPAAAVDPHHVPARKRLVAWLEAHVGTWAARPVDAAWMTAHALTASLASTGRLFKSWRRWPRLPRAAVNVTILGGILAAVLEPAAAAQYGTYGALAAVLGFAVAAITGPHGLGKWEGWKPDDELTYAPSLWLVLRQALDLPEDTYRQRWLDFPRDLKADKPRITLRLPQAFRGTSGDREGLNSLIDARVPGQWVARWHTYGSEHYVTWTPKPPPAPQPECPDRVSFFEEDVQEAMRSCKKGEVVIGKDERGEIVTQLIDDETAHWALSIGSGGGKSSFCQMVIAQLMSQGYHIVVSDVKRTSVSNFKGLPGFHLYNDPGAPQDMRSAILWWLEEANARSFIKEEQPDKEFPGFLFLLEEANEFADISRNHWDKVRELMKKANKNQKEDDPEPLPEIPEDEDEENAERAADPIWGKIASGARQGRFVNANILAVFQDLRDQSMGGKGVRNLFRLKFMGNFNAQQWKNVVATSPIPESVDKAGRVMIVEGNARTWVQTLYATPEELRDWAQEQRKLTGFDPRAGLYGTPPEHSPKVLPKLLSRDTSARAENQGPERGTDDKTAGQLSQGSPDVAAAEAAVTGPRDTAGRIPGQGSQEPAQDPTAPPELLPLSEVARRLTGVPGVPSYDTIRAHKHRRDKDRRGGDFPQGTQKDGKELFTVSQIRAYYIGKQGK